MKLKLPGLVTTPWASHEQLVSVYEGVFGAESDGKSQMSKLEALVASRNQLAVWMIRSSAFPELIELEATVSILSAIIKDRTAEESNVLVGGNSAEWKENELSALYSTAIIKFCETLKHYKLSDKNDPRSIVRNFDKLPNLKGINSYAKDLQIPLWVVDLRHDACHSRVPKLLLLRKAAAIGLKWLEEHFWQRKLIALDTIGSNFSQFLTQFLDSKDKQKRIQLAKHLKAALKINRPFAMYAIVSLLIETCSEKLGRNQLEAKKVGHSVVCRIAPLIAAVHQLGHLHTLLNSLVDELKCSNKDQKRRHLATLLFTEIMVPTEGGKVATKYAKSIEIDRKVIRKAAFKVTWTKLFHRAITNSPYQESGRFLGLFKPLIESGGVSIDETSRKRLEQLTALFAKSERLNGSANHKNGFAIKTLDDLKLLKP